MLLLTIFAFLAGAATAISPCVLPVLPALLAAGAAGGRRRPLGIVTGLALVHGLAFALAVDATRTLPGFIVGLLLAQALLVTLAGALPLASRALGRRPGARARDRARSAAR